ncbi:MAG: glutathione peroxidase [Flavobacteriales bacterium]|nr:glutathione peroxidase [Flavobacteriales bacterium]
MKTILTIALTTFIIVGIWKFIAARNKVKLVENPITEETSDIMKFCIQKLNSRDSICLRDFKGKKILIVNVASQCGFTKQYADLQKLSETYADKLVVIGFPCNQFGNQEPGEESEIEQFCSTKFNVTFPITTKVDVKGKDQHPIYTWLTSKELNKTDDYKVNWNFNKFLLNEEGQLLGHFGSRINPMDEIITNFLK